MFLKMIETLSCLYSLDSSRSLRTQMSTHVPGFQSFFIFFASFCIGQICHSQHTGYFLELYIIGRTWDIDAVILESFIVTLSAM